MLFDNAGGTGDTRADDVAKAPAPYGAERQRPSHRTGESHCTNRTVEPLSSFLSFRAGKKKTAVHQKNGMWGSVDKITTTTTATKREKKLKTHNIYSTWYSSHWFFFNLYFIIYIFIESLKVILGVFRPVRDQGRDGWLRNVHRPPFLFSDPTVSYAKSWAGCTGRFDLADPSSTSRKTSQAFPAGEGVWEGGRGRFHFASLSASALLRRGQCGGRSPGPAVWAALLGN